jgi:hypothetical protein
MLRRRRRRRRISLLAVVAVVTISTAIAADGRLPPGKSPPVLLTSPSIAGAAVEGVTLVANPGTWSGPTKSYSFRWARCDSNGAACAAISAARDVRYIVAAADVGNTLRVTVIATNKNGSTAATSSATPVVVSAAAAPTTSSPPPPPPPSPSPAPSPPPPPPPSGHQHSFPRLFMINRADDISTLWKYDWVVGAPWQDVQTYHARNPTGIAMTYVRLDNPPFEGSLIDLNKSNYWDVCSMMNIASGGVSGNNYFPGEQEKYTFENWPGGTDNLVDGQAANVGYIRPWDKALDSQHNSDGSFVKEGGCPYGTEIHIWNLAHAGKLNGQLQVYAAKKGQLYGRGWDGIWSDNAYSRYGWGDGLQTSYAFMRNSLPGKSVGGNGICISWYKNGWSGSDPEGYLKMANANLVENFASLYGAINQANVDFFISWNNRCLHYPDPYGMPRYNAFWDAYVPSSYQRVRWGLTLSLVASMYYMAPIPDPYNNPDPWYDEYWGGSLNQRGYLGQATGPAVKLPSGVWRRDFDKGIALNNSTGSTQTVSLGGTFRRLTGTQVVTVNNGSLVSSVTIPNQDGLILLR